MVILMLSGGCEFYIRQSSELEIGRRWYLVSVGVGHEPRIRIFVGLVRDSLNLIVTAVWRGVSGVYNVRIGRNRQVP
jgi:hypothetical protein